MIDNKLIESVLALTGKTMSDVTIGVGITMDFFSIEKFCYYLLSSEFIGKYYKNMYPNEEVYTYSNFFHGCVERFGNAIYEYQSGNEEPLQELLSKIGN